MGRWCQHRGSETVWFCPTAQARAKPIDPSKIAGPRTPLAAPHSHPGHAHVTCSQATMAHDVACSPLLFTQTHTMLVTLRHSSAGLGAAAYLPRAAGCSGSPALLLRVRSQSISAVRPPVKTQVRANSSSTRPPSRPKPEKQEASDTTDGTLKKKEAAAGGKESLRSESRFLSVSSLVCLLASAPSCPVEAERRIGASIGVVL